MDAILTILHVACCLFLAVVAFHRSVRTSACSTKPVVLWRLHVVTLVGVMGLIPLVHDGKTSASFVLLLLAFTVSEALSMPFWKAGAPDPDLMTQPGQLTPVGSPVASR